MMMEARTGGQCQAGRHVSTTERPGPERKGAACTVDSCSEWCDCLNKHCTVPSTHVVESGYLHKDGRRMWERVKFREEVWRVPVACD